jgi:hypothetical protein
MIEAIYDIPSGYLHPWDDREHIPDGWQLFDMKPEDVELAIYGFNTENTKPGLCLIQKV